MSFDTVSIDFISGCDVKAIIFDVDGTMADTEDAHRVAFNRAFDQAGLSWHWSVDEYRDLLSVAGGQERIVHFLHTNTGHSPTSLYDMARSLHQAKTQYYVQSIEEGSVGLRPGIAELVAQATEQRVRLAIATTTSPANVVALLSTQLGAKWANLFEVVEDAATAPNKKPCPDVYLNVLARLGLAAEECMAIEDSFNGLAAAQRAGIPTVITRNAYTQHHKFDGAVAVVNDLGGVDLAALIQLHTQAIK
ncbi:MAG: HAD-IA family hydrolase [Gammaproteobacteria bacterium]|nr:HAD-IA family hydrolase [Gammaproteobacteria bacterium]